MLDALRPWTAGSRFACDDAGAFPALTNTGACAQVQSWLPHASSGALLTVKSGIYLFIHILTEGNFFIFFSELRT
jgi:hypothetical protein